MTPSLVVIFGLPGAGKSYVAEVLHAHFRYTVYDGDRDIPQNMKDALFQKKEITDVMRREFLDNMITSIRTLSETHEKLAAHQTFLKEFMRKKIFDAFPYAKFILVETDDAIREQRYMKRDYFNLGLGYLRHMCSLFEQPRILHSVIKNNTDGTTDVIKQLQKVFTRGNP